MKYATLNANGTPNGFYDDSVHSTIPNGAIKITEEQWQECLDFQGQRAFKNGVLVEYVYVPTLTEKKDLKHSIIKTDYENAVRAMTGNTDSAEMASWTKQEQEAHAWIADNAVVTPIIDNLIIGRAIGESKADLVAKIITKADAYTVAYAQVLGAYHAKQKAIEVATTVAEVDAI